MSDHLSYQELLERSHSVNWRVDDLIGGERRLDFSRPFLPETFARTEDLAFLSPDEKLKLNHIRAREYLALFELLERAIVPFVSGQAAEKLDEDPYRAPALRQFVREENKHRELFRRFLKEFDEGFGGDCELIGPADDIARAFLAHSPLAVTIAVLGLEWMSQGHYVGSVEGNEALDPQFKNLLKHHWAEEAQHAELDRLMLRALAADCDPEAINRAVDEYFEIGAFFDAGFAQQAELDLAAFERAARRVLDADQRAQFVRSQHRALCWTFLGTAMSNANFLAALDDLGAPIRSRVEAAAGAFVLH
ncbi:hypothetical protein [Phenylobacterium montanum]|uniref:Uncharacterized protein n=1 Tax=Phenylobacterium montanum TaxID=2823693 RepID=A0A975G2Y1_9CAUL|nr:hypothetical protein [Caulobacter sp. S6]QUD90170.1 hypothetical protein KCG34_10025 [Caulobacter sp. S6]